MLLNITSKYNPYNLLLCKSSSYFQQPHATKRLCEIPATYSNDNTATLSNTELLEQCFALISAIITMVEPATRESLLFILEEKLVHLSSRLH